MERTFEFGVPGIHLAPGSHLCALYRADEAETILRRYVSAGIAAHERCICLVAEDLAAMLAELNTADGGECPELDIVTPVQSYLQEAEFRSASMLSFWENKVRDSIDRCGFEFMRSLGDLTWASSNLLTGDAFIAYESELNRFLPRYPQIMLCMYDVDRVSGDVVVAILETHPLVLVSGMVMDNPYYLEPAEFLARRS